jgi:tetrapyrrole (corrin/porphyrin) methylase-like protein
MQEEARLTRGSLCAVGIGIRAPLQTTNEARECIERADKVFSIVADPVAQLWLTKLNACTESLSDLYRPGVDRSQTYEEMVRRILGAVREGLQVCAVSYGHPGVAAYPLHESVRRARAEGFPAEMLAAVSAEDCLFADLGVDPINGGCRSYEATDFLVYARAADPASNLVLWQIGAIAELSYRPQRELWNPHGISVLTDVLLQTYPPDHEVVVYEAACFAPCAPKVVRVALRDLPNAGVTPLSTLFVPPCEVPAVDETMLRRLRMRA